MTGQTPSRHPSRRTLLVTGATGLAVAATAGASRPGTAAGLLRHRGDLPSGIQMGDVSPHAAVLWARSDRPGRMIVRIGRGGRDRQITGPWALPAGDHTAKLELTGLAAGRDYDIAIGFEDADGVRGQFVRGSMRTPSVRPAAQTFVWTGDTAGQGWGRNPDLDGMPGYRAMAATCPDFLIHSGDNIYADGPIHDRVVEPDGQVWRNVVTEEVSKVAETLTEFRGRYRYNQDDAGVRAMYAHVPVIAQWDDHETTNNWYPGEVLDSPQYRIERRVDVLAARARRAFGENMPIAGGYLATRSGWYDLRTRATRGHGGRQGQGHVRDGSAGPQRIYRKVSRGAHLDVFCLDMRTYRGANNAAAQAGPVAMLGAEQAAWLVRELRASRATWKVIASDMPLGLIVPDEKGAQEGVADGRAGRPGGREHEIAAVLTALKRHRVRNVVWLTADVHYAAAHHYDPARSAGLDFDPFYEFVAGAIHAGSFGPGVLDPTFGPQTLFSATGQYPAQSPRAGTNQFFGHVEITTDASMRVSLRDATGAIRYRHALEPDLG